MHAIMLLVDGHIMLHLQETIKIPSGVTGLNLFSYKETPSKGNIPSKLESKGTKHISPYPIEYLSIC